jgi:hypothetical protein
MDGNGHLAACHFAEELETYTSPRLAGLGSGAA